MYFDWYEFGSFMAGLLGVPLYAAAVLGWINGAPTDAHGADRKGPIDYRAEQQLRDYGSGIAAREPVK